MKYLVKLDLTKEWKMTLKGKYNLSEFCKIISEKLENISLKKCHIDHLILDDLTWARLVIVEMFKDISSDKTTMIEFDRAMGKLYTWANFSHSYNLKSCEVII